MTRILLSTLLASLLTVAAGQAAEPSPESPVHHGGTGAVRFRARVEGGFLIVQATHEPGWHSYAMDNELRAAEKLAGKQSLGIEQGVAIAVTSGGELAPPWYQSPPHDLSQPELRWYTWGFDGESTFACKLERAGTEAVSLQITGQACDGKTCKAFDVQLTVQPSASTAEEPAFSTDNLVRVRSPE